MISAVMNGNSTSITSFNRNVGIESSDDDLDGDAMIMRRTSASVLKQSVINFGFVDVFDGAEVFVQLWRRWLGCQNQREAGSRC